VIRVRQRAAGPPGSPGEANIATPGANLARERFLDAIAADGDRSWPVIAEGVGMGS
jgi:hypothetical protein